MITFKELNLTAQVQQALDELGFTEPTEIQQKAIPMLMAKDFIDFHGQAQTGTGKTLAFGIPLLHRIDQAKRVPQALIVAPTRELALQIKDSISQVARGMDLKIEAIYGGVSMEEQIKNLKRGAHIIVGTPGRLNDHLRRRTLSVAQIRTLVLDEADIMLDMGFKEEVDEILTYAPKNREIWLFSATVKSGITDLMSAHMKDPLSVRVSKKQITAASTKQYFCVIPMRSRLQALCRFIESSPDFYGFIFCQTKLLTSEVAELLIKRGYNVGALHGDMSQAQRNLVIKRFKQKELIILIATDVAARGIDVANLTHVVNYSVPEDHESYVHRIGRTGRAGKDGIAITFINKAELRIIQHIQRKFNVAINPLDVPSRDSIVAVRVEEATRYLQGLAQAPVHTDDKHLNAFIEALSERQLKTIVTRLAHDKFLGTVDSDDISYTAAHKIVAQDQLQEIFINVGSDDGVNRDDVVAYLTKTGHVKSDQIHKVRVIKRRTFVELPSDCTQQLIDSLRGKSLAGRKTRVALITEERENSRY
jgi:ATP-dependent RNA helicase DeaD